MQKKRSPTGIRVRHRQGCRTRSGGDCNCKPAYEPFVFSARHGRKIRKTFPTLAAAKSWRADAQVALHKGRLAPGTSATVGQAWREWLAGAESGVIRTRDGHRFKPSAVRSYRSTMEKHVLPELERVRLSSVTWHDLQDLIDRLLAGGLGASTVRNVLMPVRSLYRRASERGDVAVNPTGGLRLPATRLTRVSALSPDDVAKLLAALPDAERAIWGTAFYCGLRLGELQALRWEDIDLDDRVVSVVRSWDGKGRLFVEPKSSAGRRLIPMPEPLRGLLIAHRLRLGRGTGLAFGRDEATPFVASTTWRRAHGAWDAAGLDRVSLHIGRHAFVSFMIAAGVNPKALSIYAGHAQITTTLDRYGHLLPGNEAEAAELLDDYLQRAADCD